MSSDISSDIQRIDDLPHRSLESLRQHTLFLEGENQRLREQLASHSSSLFEQAFHSHPASLAILDSNGNILQVNQAWIRYRKENQGLPTSHDAHPENYLEVCERALTSSEGREVRAVMEGIRAVLNRSALRFEHDYTCSSTVSPKQWFHVVVTPIDHPVGSALVKHYDVTFAKQQEDAIRRIQLRFEQVMDATQVGFLDWDLHTNRIEFGPQWNRLLGEPESLTPSLDTLLARIHPEDLPRFQAACLEHRSHLTPHIEYEFRLKTYHAGYRWFLFRATTVEWNPPHVPRRILGSITDISDRKHAEAQQQTILTILNNIANRLPCIVYEFRILPDGTMCCPYISDRLRDIFELEPHEVTDNASAIFNRIHPEDLQPLFNSINASAEKMEPWLHEYRIQFPDGRIKWISGNSSPTREADHTIVWHGFLTDITNKKEEEQNHNRLLMQLQQTLRLDSIGRLAGGIAHDFNNMLGVILGHAELALRHANENLVDDLNAIQKAASRSADLTRQLLAFARCQTVEPSYVHLNQRINEMLGILPRLLGEDITVRFSPGENLPHILIDPTQIEQILTNLCLNARDSISGIGSIDISTSLCHLDRNAVDVIPNARPGTFVRLSVRDDGCGMNTDTLERIFEPFFTTKERGKGTGLGLATVYGAVHQNSGFINVDSRPAQGSRFDVYLPATHPQEINPSTPPADHPLTHGNEAILVVEDEPALMALTQIILEDHGYRVLCASSPLQALSLIEEPNFHIDLLISDVIMPEMHGRDLADSLTHRIPGLRSLFMSGYPSDIIAERGALQAGTQFLPKPFAAQQLLSKVREVLDTP